MTTQIENFNMPLILYLIHMYVYIIFKLTKTLKKLHATKLKYLMKKQRHSPHFDL